MGVSTGVRSLLSVCLLWLLALGLVAGTVAVTPSSACAQEGGEEKKPEDKHGSDEGENLFIFMLKSVGWFFGIVLALVSLLLVGLIAFLAMDLRMSVAIPPSFVDDFTDTVNKRQFKQAFDMCREDSSFLGRVLSAGMGRLQYGIEDARLATNNMVDNIKASKAQLINYLATIGTLGPMLGLVGTVFGMILAFRDLAIPGRPPNPQALAANISHALVVTLVGVALSVPAIFCTAFFNNRLTRITHDTSHLGDDLLTQMYHNSKKAGAAPPTTSGPSTRAPS